MQIDYGAISDLDFNRFRQLLLRVSGIRLSENKKALVCNKLGRYLRQQNFPSYSDYFDHIASRPEDELQTLVNLLTINETHFFREPGHFDFLSRAIVPELRFGPMPRIWSAACSSGEEAYSLAMVLSDSLGREDWEVVGSDINTHVLEQAARGSYPMARTDEIPREYLQRYCLRGTGDSEGRFMISPRLRERTVFQNVNLLDDFTFLGEFDLVFLVQA
jgi:chemotaxis protein methyltransferase CheR